MLAVGLTNWKKVVFQFIPEKRESIFITVGCKESFNFIEKRRNIIIGLRNTPLGLVHCEKFAPWSMRTGQMFHYFFDLLIPSSTPLWLHVLMLEYNAFYIISGCPASEHALRLWVYYTEELKELKGIKWKIWIFFWIKFNKTYNISKLATQLLLWVDLSHWKCIENRIQCWQAWILIETNRLGGIIQICRQSPQHNNKRSVILLLFRSRGRIAFCRLLGQAVYFVSPRHDSIM